MTKQTLNVNILERFMTTEQMKKLLGEYDNNKKQLGYGNRIETLKQEVTDVQKEMIREYFTEGSDLKVLANKYGVNTDKVRNTVYNACTRLV